MGWYTVYDMVVSTRRPYDTTKLLDLMKNADSSLIRDVEKKTNTEFDTWCGLGNLSCLKKNKHSYLISTTIKCGDSSLLEFMVEFIQRFIHDFLEIQGTYYGEDSYADSQIETGSPKTITVKRVYM